MEYAIRKLGNLHTCLYTDNRHHTIGRDINHQLVFLSFFFQGTRDPPGKVNPEKAKELSKELYIAGKYTPTFFVLLSLFLFYLV